MKTGLEIFLDRDHKRFRGSRLGVLCNQASVNSKLRHIRDLFADKKLKLNITCFFGPQHGIRGEKQDNMVESEDTRDSLLNVPVYSLYSTHREPSRASMQSIDTLIIDLQDVGTRIYTFMYTMANCMRVAKDCGKKVVVLDRPNPIGGDFVEGNILEPGFSSFVGQFPLATRHGLTMGELAVLFNETFEIRCDLEVIRLKGWKRKSTAYDWDQPWVPPSPNVPMIDSVLVFPGSVLFEGTNISEGRGTTRPFEWIGAPFLDADHLAQAMNRKKLPGVYYRPIYFQPTYHKGMGEVCGGVHIHVVDARKFPAALAGLELLEAIFQQSGDNFKWKAPPYEYEHKRTPIDLIAGTDKLRKELESSGSLRDFKAQTRADQKLFLKAWKDIKFY